MLLSAALVAMVTVMHVSTGTDTNDHGSVPRRHAYRVEEVAALLGDLHIRTVWRLIQAGELDSFKVGRRRMVAAEAIDEYIAKQRRDAAASAA